jgi:hypothetical protein
MPFGLLVQFVDMAMRHDTVEFTVYENNVLHVYFENGEEWKVEVT